MYWALIINGKIHEITTTDPSGRFAPTLTWVSCTASEEVGDLYDGTFSKPVVLLADAKTAKKAELDAAYDAAANADVTYGGNVYQADKIARENLAELSVYRGTGGSLPVGFTWRTKANSNVAFTWTDVDGLITAIANQKFAAVANMHTKKDALDAAADVAAVNAITW